MKVEEKAFKLKDLSELTGKLTFKAETEVDAVQLAALHNQWINPKGRVKQLREEALVRYCKNKNVTIKATPR